MCVGDLSNAVCSAQIRAGVSKSMLRGHKTTSDPADLAKSAKLVIILFRPFSGPGSMELHWIELDQSEGG